MIRYLECHDLHVSPENIEITEGILYRIETAAREHAVDFVVTSDLHDKNFYLCKEYNRFRASIKRILAVCPIAAVVGTPGHETEAMYGPLIDIGLVMLSPGHAYGCYKRSDRISYIGEIIPGKSMTPDTILFGVPELTKQTIQADLQLPSTEANAKAEELFARYVREYIAPMRSKYPDVPAIGVLHGTVTDYSRENEIDVKKKSAAIIIRTEDLAEAHMTRWSLGHIHAPWESSKICAGYAGSWGTSWNETGFIPAMNLVTISSADTLKDLPELLVPSISRIPYGTPAREKIAEPLPAYSPDIAYWLDSADPDAPCPSGHAWSRVTHTPQRKESRRITQEQAQDARLRDLFKLFDPNVYDATLDLVDGLEQLNTQNMREPIDISVDSVRIEGCIFWGSRSISFAPASLPSGLTQIDGKNGEGKSSLAAFCTPYPVIIGKDTKSGRASAIKDFFDMPDSCIEKNLTVNGIPHHHLITIRGAHTQTPKVECYLEINGVPQLDQSTFDEMFSKCEQLYGSYTDYLLTTFYVQPLQGKTGSSLMSATMTDIRDLVQTIAGIDRETQKRQALDTASGIEKKLVEKESWVSGAVSNSVDTVALIKKRATLIIQEAVQQNYLISVTDSGKAKKTEIATLIEMQRTTTAERERKKGDDLLYSGAMNKIEMITNEIKEISELSDKLPENLAALATDDTRLSRMQKRQEIVNANMTATNAHGQAILEYQTKLSDAQLKVKTRNNKAANEYSSALSLYNSRKSEYESTINHANKPCEHCHEIPYADAAKKLETARAQLAALVVPVCAVIEVVPLQLSEPQPVPPVLETVPELEPCTINRLQLESNIETGRKSKATIEANDKQLLELNAQIQVLSDKIYDIDETIDAAVTAAETKLEQLRTEHGTARQTIAGIQAEAASITTQIETADAKAKEIDAAREEIVTLSDTLGRWKYIAVQLRPEKIPAMELDLVLDLIDIEATRNLSPYQDGAYTFQTRTQRVGKKDVVDAFDITVHDAQTGREKSFLAFSPGQKAFLNDAYVKALIRIRNQRAHITYSPIISDEADSPIEIPMIPTFYAMQERYYSQEKVLVISHTPDARNYIANRIQIKELIG
jgi:hypothetical protein